MSATPQWAERSQTTPDARDTQLGVAGSGGRVRALREGLVVCDEAVLKLNRAADENT